MIKVFIFDLDGVIAETSKQHFQAWKGLANMLDINIDLEFNERLKGISRIDSLIEILSYGNKDGKYTTEELEKLSFCKNEYYKNLIKKFTRADVFDGVVEMFEILRGKNIKIAIGSASHNAPDLIKAMELEEYVDYIVNPSEVSKGKPEPDIFLKASEYFDVSPKECIGIEDAVAGIRAIKSAGMYAVGIGDKNVLLEADIVYPKIADIILEDLV